MSGTYKRWACRLGFHRLQPGEPVSAVYFLGVGMSPPKAFQDCKVSCELCDYEGTQSWRIFAADQQDQR